MPSEVFSVTQIVGRNDTDQVNVRDINRIITELNKVLSSIAITLGKVQGQDGATSKFANDADFDSHNLLNVGQIKFFSRQHARGAQPFSGKYAVDDPLDLPGTPEALRNDLADNVLPDITVALNDLGKNLKRVLDVLKI